MATVEATFITAEDARRAVAALERAGVDADLIHVDTPVPHDAAALPGPAATGLVQRVLAAAVAGALGGAVVGVVLALVLDDAETWLFALFGAGLGSMVGGLAAAVTNLPVNPEVFDVPESRATIVRIEVDAEHEAAVTTVLAEHDPARGPRR